MYPNCVIGLLKIQQTTVPNLNALLKFYVMYIGGECSNPVSRTFDGEIRFRFLQPDFVDPKAS